MSLLDISETPPGLKSQSWRTNINDKGKSQVLERKLEMKSFNSAAAFHRLNSIHRTSDGKNEYTNSDNISTSSFAASTKTSHMFKNSPSAIAVEDDERFINHEAENSENKHSTEEPNSPMAHFEDDSDTQDEAIFKSEEFDDDSEMNDQSVEYCKLKGRPLSVEGLDNSNEISYCNDTIISTVPSPRKEMNTFQSSFKEVNKFQSSFEDVRGFQYPSKKSKTTYMQRLSLGRIPNHVKCFCCQRIVKEDHFSEHLFFGAVKCSKCNSFFRNCQIFTAWSAEYAIEYGLCDHIFVFVNDPLVYITENLSLSEVEHRLGNEEFVSALEKYIYKIRSLESTLPWKYAILKCKDHIALKKLKNNFTLKNALSDLGVSRNVSEYKVTEYLGDFSETNSSVLSQKSTGAEESEDQEKEDCSTLNERDGFSEMTRKGNLNKSGCFVDEEHSQNSEELSTSKRDEVISSVLPHRIYDKDMNHQLLPITQFSCTNGTNKELDLEESLPNQIGLKAGSREISTTFAVECDKAKNHIKDTVCSKKRKRKQNSTTKKLGLKITNCTSLNMVDVPSDGFYLVTISPIEECPNCYCKLCPSRATVNCKTFLITFICPDCDLVIYIANDDTIILTEKVGSSVGGSLNESVICNSDT